MAKRPKPVHQMTEAQFEAMFPHEEACIAYLIARRWPNGVFCPRCGNTKVFAMKAMANKWQCYECETVKGAGYRFSHIAGTIFENTNKPLRQWFKVTHLMMTSKKGMSALQIMRHMGFGSYRTAWSMCHKIRAALIEPETKLGGIVEVDETYIGGKAINKHRNKQTVHGGPGGKVPIIGAVSRKGNVIARVLRRTSKTAADGFVREVVSHKVSLLATDESRVYQAAEKQNNVPGPIPIRSPWNSVMFTVKMSFSAACYDDLGTDYPHGTVNHRARQYVIGAIHTNTIEGFWSIFKRGIVGSFHKVSAKYMPLYVAEFQFRYNNRMNADIFGTAIEGC